MNGEWEAGVDSGLNHDGGMLASFLHPGRPNEFYFTIRDPRAYVVTQIMSMPLSGGSARKGTRKCSGQGQVILSRRTTQARQK